MAELRESGGGVRRGNGGEGEMMAAVGLKEQGNSREWENFEICFLCPPFPL